MRHHVSHTARRLRLVRPINHADREAAHSRPSSDGELRHHHSRVESPTAVIEGKMYLFDGFTDLGASLRVAVYDPAADTWARKKDMPTRLTRFNPAVDVKTIWFAVGFKGKHNGPVAAEEWKYDLATDAWAAGPALPERRGGWSQAALFRRLQVRSRHELRRSLEPVAVGKAWEGEADLLNLRGQASAAMPDGQIYALGGGHGQERRRSMWRRATATPPPAPAQRRPSRLWMLERNDVQGAPRTE